MYLPAVEVYKPGYNRYGW